MNKALLADPTTATSAAWADVSADLGPDIDDYEPDTIRLELKRRGIEATDTLMAKLMSAQTAHAHPDVLAHDHDAVFAFALAEDGIPADASAIHHPTVDQLCWAMRELNRLSSGPYTDDEGFDPDEVDPAVACVMLEEGFVVAPEELHFAQGCLDSMSHADAVLRGEVEDEWSKLSGKGEDALRKALEGLPETDVNVQLFRLADARRYVLEKEHARERRTNTHTKSGR